MMNPGTLLQNRYRVAEQIGKGGMGEVYVATDERFQSAVAIKRTFYDDPQMLRAFEREARLLNRLRHAALPKVSDHFSEGGGQFLVMEFIEGSDLSELLRQRKVSFPLADVLRWADDLLDALEYLHAQEPPVVHRDIKPPNIKLTPRGRVVLLDFGLAKGMPAQTASGPASSVFGYSLNFAPLEQMQGAGTDTRSDLYSLAATLYFLLTGVRPPDALTRAAAAVKHQPDPLRPAHLVQPQVPSAVGQILHRAMAQDPGLRHASAADLRAELRRAADAASRGESLPKAAGEKAPPLKPSSPQDATLVEARGKAEWSRSYRSSAAKNLSPHEGDPPLTGSPDRQSLADSLTVSARRSPEKAGAASNRIFALFACLLVVCAVSGIYLLTRGAPTRAPADVTGAGPQNHSTQYQIPPAEQTASGASAAAPYTPDKTPESQAPETSATRLKTGPASDPQAKPEPTVAAGSSQTVGQTSAGLNTDGGSPSAAGRGLVIQNPMPAATATPAEETRRAEESRPRQPQYQPAPYGPPPPCPGCPPPPPPGGRLPPPDGRRPPPR